MHRYVGEWDGPVGIFCQPGNEGKAIRRDPGDGYLKRWITDAPPFDRTWQRTHVLRFMQEGSMHTVEVWWDAEWSFLGWYVNLQAPLVIQRNRFDTTDWALDIVVEPDGTWHWKDEDEFEEAIELGVFEDIAAAEAVRTEGERVVAEKPWPTGWEEWRPPATWAPLALPDDWHVV